MLYKCRRTCRPWQVAHFATHLPGKRPISRQVEHFLAHLTGLAVEIPDQVGNDGKEDRRKYTICAVKRVFLAAQTVLCADY